MCSHLCFSRLSLVQTATGGMAEYISQTGSSMKVRIRYDARPVATNVYGVGLHGGSGSDQAAYNAAFGSCDANFNFLVRFDC